jgi:adenylate cyclase
MTRSAGRVILACGLVPTLAVAALCMARPAAFANLEYGVYDRMVRLVGVRPPGGRVVIVDVDEASLEAVGQWPWPRDVIATLVTKLRDRGAIVALDIMFAEADRRQPASGGDAVLADTLRQGRVVLGYALTFDGAATAPPTCDRHALELPIVASGDEAASEPFFRATRAICNVEALSAAGRHAGFLNAAPDVDGILRRVPLLVEFQGRVYPSLALAAFAAASNMQPTMLRILNVNASVLVVAGATPPAMAVPLDGKSNLLVRYRGVKDTFMHVSAIDVLRGHLPTDLPNDAIVFVGTTALGTREVVATPLDTLFTGLEVQATVADNLLQRDFYCKPPYTVALETFVVVFAGLVGALCTSRSGFAAGVLGLAVLLGATWGASALGMTWAGLVVSPLFPSIGLLASNAAMTGARAVLESRRADSADREQSAARRLMVQTLLSLVEMRDPDTGRHSRRTQGYTRVLAEALMDHPRFREYLTPERVDLLAVLAPLHDIGKVAIPDAILNKPGPLTAEEFAEIRKHPAYGREVIETAEQAADVSDDMTLAIAKDIVYTHHERWDGTGYPHGLRGTDISVPGRLMAIVDVYDAIRSPRPYHPAKSHDDVVSIIRAERGKHFDPDVVDAYMQVSEVFRQLSAEDPAAAPRGFLAARTA